MNTAARATCTYDEYREMLGALSKAARKTARQRSDAPKPIDDDGQLYDRQQCQAYSELQYGIRYSQAAYKLENAYDCLYRAVSRRAEYYFHRSLQEEHAALAIAGARPVPDFEEHLTKNLAAIAEIESRVSTMTMHIIELGYTTAQSAEQKKMRELIPYFDAIKEHAAELQIWIASTKDACLNNPYYSPEARTADVTAAKEEAINDWRIVDTLSEAGNAHARSAYQKGVLLYKVDKLRHRVYNAARFSPFIILKREALYAQICADVGQPVSYPKMTANSVSEIQRTEYAERLKTPTEGE